MGEATIGPETEARLDREENVMLPRIDRAPAKYWTRAGPVRGPLARQDTEVLSERVQAATADPVALGLAGFASARFTIGSIYAGWFGFSPGEFAIAIPVALIFGGITPFLAGMWAFRRGHLLAATVFATFGSFNASWAVLQWMMVAGLAPAIANGGSAGYVDGVAVLTFSLIAFYLGLAALTENLGLAAVLFMMTLTHAFLGAWAMAPHVTWLRVVGGYCSIVSASLAFLVSATIVINSALGRELIPLIGLRSAQR